MARAVFKCDTKLVRDGMSGKQIVLGGKAYLKVSYACLLVTHIGILLKEAKDIETIVVKSDGRTEVTTSVKKRARGVFGKSISLVWR